MDVIRKITEAAKHIQDKIIEQPVLGIILGSGLGSLADEIQNPTVIKYGEIPYFPLSTVAGHAGELVIGRLEGKYILAMNGRFHYYEGYPLNEVTFPVRVMKALGINTLIVTNACGGMNPDFYAGALMLIEDHINFMWNNPLMGPNCEELGPRFPDISRAYDKELIALGRSVAQKLGIEVKSGVYCGISGPSYMTPAELRMLRGWGADAVGMSTIPEVIVAAHMSMKVMGVSCVTDMAIADQLEPLDHETVMKMALQTKPKFINLLKGIIKDI